MLIELFGTCSGERERERKSGRKVRDKEIVVVIHQCKTDLVYNYL